MSNLRDQTTYGTVMAICELKPFEFSIHGCIDGYVHVYTCILSKAILDEYCGFIVELK